MKKLAFLVFVLVLVPVFVFAGMKYYNLAIMDTAQMQKPGSFALTATDDFAYRPGDYAQILNYTAGKLSYVILDGLEAALEYDVQYYNNISDDKSSMDLGLGKVGLRYAFGVGDIIRIGIGAGVGAPFTEDRYEFSFSGMGALTVAPSLCVSAKLGAIGLHFQAKDMISFWGESDIINWMRFFGAVAFEAGDSFTAAVSGGVDVLDKDSFITGGPEIAWNVAGPVHLNIGAFFTMFDGDLYIRGLLKVGIIL